MTEIYLIIFDIIEINVYYFIVQIVYWNVVILLILSQRFCQFGFGFNQTFRNDPNTY